jgi:hypothetical protein
MARAEVEATTGNNRPTMMGWLAAERRVVPVQRRVLPVQRPIVDMAKKVSHLQRLCFHSLSGRGMPEHVARRAMVMQCYQALHAPPLGGTLHAGDFNRARQVCTTQHTTPSH